MAPSGVDVLPVVLHKNRLIFNVKCTKCNKKVCNGILCDLCDKWSHFKCAGLSDNDIPGENEEWKCRLCVGLDCDVEKEDSVESLKEIIAVLTGDLENLKIENNELKNSLNKWVSVESNVSTVQGERNNNSPTTAQYQLHWETVRGKCYPSYKSTPNDFLPLKNKYSVLSDLCEDTVRPEVGPVNLCGRNEESSRPRPTLSNESTKHSSARSRPIVRHKIHLFADSQGRSVASELISKGSHKVESVVKPGASFKCVTEEACHEDLTEEDVTVFLAGTNDIGRNDRNSLRIALRRRILSLPAHTNLVVFSIPYRHDLISWSCVNKEVDTANREMLGICQQYNNVHFVDISRLGRRFHTSHGLHLNSLGKKYVADKVLDILSKLASTKAMNVKEPIAIGYDQSDFLG